jgi:hypothetical protein
VQRQTIQEREISHHLTMLEVDTLLYKETVHHEIHIFSARKLFVHLDNLIVNDNPTFYGICLIVDHKLPYCISLTLLYTSSSNSI